MIRLDIIPPDELERRSFFWPFSNHVHTGGMEYTAILILVVGLIFLGLHLLIHKPGFFGTKDPPLRRKKSNDKTEKP